MSIIAETRFEDHFPVSVMIAHYKHVDDINDAVFEILRSLKKNYLTDKNENEVLTGTVTTFGGYQTPTRVMFLNRSEQNIQKLRDEMILPSVDIYLKKVSADKNNEINIRLFSWANILAAGDWQAPHMHPTINNLASGVYYVRVPGRPSPEGCIEFLNPHPVAVHHGYSLTHRIQPTSGDLIMFPPYYLHYVYPFSGNEERAIVAFDVIMQPKKSVF